MKTFKNQKRKGQMVSHGITPVLPIAGQKFPQYSEEYLEHFAVFQNSNVFIARFIAELLSSRNPLWETLVYCMDLQPGALQVVLLCSSLPHIQIIQYKLDNNLGRWIYHALLFFHARPVKTPTKIGMSFCYQSWAPISVLLTVRGIKDIYISRCDK
jgi:hypothetical protein